MKIREVATGEDAEDFLTVAKRINANDPNWVCPLDKDINGVFSPDLNPFYGHGKTIRWVLIDENQQLIGRIAAFIDYNTTKDTDLPIGGCGFFECIDDQETANVLFDTAKQWLVSNDVQGMDGPINFGETNKFWGLLIEGFSQPAYQIAYNQPYYQQLFETYGFQVYYYQEGFHLDITKPIPERFKKIAAWVANKPDYHFEHLSFSKLDKHAKDFTTVFNEAWKDFKEDFQPMQVEYARKFMREAKMVLEEKFIWYGYFKGEPIAIYLMYPDFNQLFKGFKGKLSLWNKIKLFVKLKSKKVTRARGVLMGVVPKFQGMGIESAFIHHLEIALKDMPQYKELEFSWVGDFNPPMRKLWVSVGAEPVKKYATYRFLFDRNRKFERYPIPEG